ncbi:hypothetical protein SLS64_013094 [Diaporthe eres]|uniref:F-box domain-containing protein n=1 Tax=Diaporthe eres TaxID=83184 RepID=A0ABR1P330_DIAER
MDLSAILNDVQDEESPLVKGEAEPAQITETRHGLPRLLRLPAVLHDPIISHLTNRDIKSLRLTCTFFHGIARLRLRRVFISAHHRDVQVLRAVADSDTFRSGVTELIWDDARLSNSPHLAQAHDENVEDDTPETHDNNDSEVPKWFTDACKENIDDLNSRKGLDADRPEHAAQAEQLNTRLPPAACWAHYQELLREQEAVTASGADEAAFRYALQRFPSLERVTITPAAHGWLFSPLYETPTIRALPYGFNYPIPRGWPTAPDGCPPHNMRPWLADGEGEVYKEQWCGVRAALRVLAEPQTEHRITELVLDAHHLNTGLNCRIFEHPATNAEYVNLCALLRRPGFSRLDLALALGGQEHLGWPTLRGDHLRGALAGAPDLRHFSLRTNVVPDPDARALVRGSGGNPEHHVPLGSLLPVDSWTNLRHCGLSGFHVTQADVMSLLRALPGSLRSVELSFLYFVDGGGDWRGLLGEMRDTLDWRGREAACRPAVVVGHGLIAPWCGRAVWAGREAVGSFLYGDGPNPFGDEGEPAPNQIVMRNGTGVVRDAFDPSYERPYVDNAELIRLGIVKKAR